MHPILQLLRHRRDDAEQDLRREIQNTADALAIPLHNTRATNAADAERLHIALAANPRFQRRAGRSESLEQAVAAVIALDSTFYTG